MNTQDQSNRFDWEAFWMAIVFVIFEIVMIQYMQSVKGPSAIIAWIFFFIGSTVVNGWGLFLAIRECVRSLHSQGKTASNHSRMRMWLNPSRGWR